MSTKPQLVWKSELPAGDDPAGSPDDVGPAWLNFPQTATSSQRSEKVRGGEWITRREAHEIAKENGYELQEDDGRPDPDSTESSEPPAVDDAAINARLRALGVSADELTVESIDAKHVRLTGTILNKLREPKVVEVEGMKFKFSTAGIQTSPEQALEKIDSLLPGWRSDD